jgi:hypothetical protein
MRPLKIEPKEIDIIVASLEQSLIYWSEKIIDGNLPKEFSQEVADSLFQDILLTYHKFCDLQIQADEEPALQQEPLPENVLKFPGE